MWRVNSSAEHMWNVRYLCDIRQTRPVKNWLSQNSGKVSGIKCWETPFTGKCNRKAY